VYTTSSLDIPPVQGVPPSRPGASPTDLVQAMAKEMVVLVLTNASAVSMTSNAGAEFAHGNQRLLLVLSTELSVNKAGAPVRGLTMQLRSDVTSTHPIEPDTFQGFAGVPGADNTNWFSPTASPGMPPTFRGDRSCSMSWVGSKIGNANGGQLGGSALRLPGGSAQLLSVSLAADFSNVPRSHGAGAEAAAARRQMVGRRAPRKVTSLSP